MKRIISHFRGHWVCCLIALGIAGLFFLDWFSVSVFIVSLSGHVSEIYSQLSYVIDLLRIEVPWLSTLAWMTRAFYLIPIAQAIYFLFVLAGSRFSVWAGMIASWLSFLMTALYIVIQLVADSYISRQFGSGIIDLQSAPICLLVLSLANGILLTRLLRKSSLKHHAGSNAS